jgi:hypothetical protein
MTETTKNDHFRRLANGDVCVWINEGGAITIKVNDEFGPPELAEDEALEIAAALIDLVRKAQS